MPDSEWQSLLNVDTLILTDETNPTYTYSLTSQLTYSRSHIATVALLKRGGTLDPLSPIASQLLTLNVPGGDETPYESLHSLISGAMKPLFDAFVASRSGGKEGDAKMGMYLSLE